MKSLIKKQSVRRASKPIGFEPLEARQMYTVTGFSLVNQSDTFAAANTTVVNQPTIFQSEISTAWKQLATGAMKLQGQTLGQEVTTSIQQQSKKQGVWAYNITTGFNQNGNYNAALNGQDLDISFTAKGNSASFTSTVPGPTPSGWDPTFHVTYDLTLSIDLTLPSNLSTGQVTAKASATTSNVFVSTNSVLVGFAGAFGFNFTQVVANGINGTTQDISSIVPVGQLNSALSVEKALGYTHLQTGLDSSGNLVLTAQKPSLIINGNDNDHITLSTGSGGSLVVTAKGQTHTYAGGYFRAVTVNTASGINTVKIPSLPAGIAVQVNGNGASGNVDIVTLGGVTSLADMKGVVSVNNQLGRTDIYIDDSHDTANIAMAVSGEDVVYSGRTVLVMGNGVESVGVYGGSGQNTDTINGTVTQTDLFPGTAAGSVVNVQAVSAPLYIDGSARSVAINIGSLAPSLGGTLTNIAGAVTVTNTSATSTLSLDDSGDTVARNGTISSSSVSGFGMPSAGVVRYTGSQLGSLTVRTDVLGNTTSVLGTSTTTNLYAVGSINVLATTGALNIDGQDGADAITIGSLAPSLGGTLANITGAVTVTNTSAQASTLTVDDSGDWTARNGTLSPTQITGLSTGAINYNGSQLSTLKILGPGLGGTLTETAATSAIVTGFNVIG